jgi:hypothetical protein
MAAKGVAEMTSSTSIEDEEDDARLWRKNGDDGALVVALRRENASEANER